VTRTRLGRWALQLVMPVGLVALWWWTSADSTSYLYPPLSDVVTSLREDWFAERLGSDLVPSLGRFGAGYLISAIVGVVAGTLIGLAPRVRLATLPVTEFIRSLPAPLLLPFAIVLFGIGNGSKVGLIVLGSVWPVLLNTVDGVRGVDPEVRDVARSFGIGGRLQISRVILPAASPKIAAGLRVALSVALLLMLVSEMRTGTNGLGFQIRSAQRSFDTPDAYAGVIVIGIVGIVLNQVFVALERRVMRWHHGARGLLDETGTAGGWLV
jgi:ABC-type nitrate/sulfonate/bicarbonate transport system permease component